MLVFLQLSGLIKFVLNIAQAGLLFFLAINVSSSKKVMLHQSRELPAFNPADSADSDSTEASSRINLTSKCSSPINGTRACL